MDCTVFQKKMFKINFVNVVLAYQTWARRRYIVMPLEKGVRKGLLECYYLCIFIARCVKVISGVILP